MELNQIVRILIVLVLPILCAVGGGALYSRSRKRWLRIVGLVLSLTTLLLLAAFFFVPLLMALSQVPGGFGDIIVALFAIPFLIALPAALTPLLSTWIRPSLAWIAPSVISLGCAALAFLAIRGTAGTGSPTPVYLLLLLAALILSPLVTWLACFFRNPRCRASADATAS